MSECVLAVDIGGTGTKVGVLDSSGNLHATGALATVPPVTEYIHRLVGLMRESIATAEPQGLKPVGIGVAVAGFLKPERDRLLYNPNLSWLEGFPLGQRIHDAFRLPVELESDSNSACMAEQHFGCGRESKRFLCVTAGTGLGVGMAVDGEPLRIAYGCLGDIGHIIVQPNGLLCSCGGLGCAEALLSAPRLALLWAEKTGAPREGVSLRNVIEAARLGDEQGTLILEKAGEYLGIAIASMANTLFPDVIAIAGGLSAAGDIVLQPAERAFRKSASIFARENVTFSQAMLGAQATLVGAAWPFWGATTRK